MSTANRFEIETSARQRQADIEYQLKLSAKLGDHRAAKGTVAMGVHLRRALIIAATVGLSLLLAIGLSFRIGFALAAIH